MTEMWEPLAVSVEDAVRLSGIGRTLLYSLLADGTIQSRKAGKRRIVVYASLKAFINGSEK